MGLYIHYSPFFSNRSWWISGLLCWCCHNSNPTVTNTQHIQERRQYGLQWFMRHDVNMIERSQFSLEQSIEMDIFKSGCKSNCLYGDSFKREPPFHPHCGSPLPSFQREEHLLLADFGASGEEIFTAWGNLSPASNQTWSKMSSRRFFETLWSYGILWFLPKGIWEVHQSPMRVPTPSP